MRILTRYIIKELIGPTFLGFGFYTFMILMKALFDFAEMIIKRSLPISTVGRLLALSLPHIVVLTVPMSLLFGILIAVGRLSSDSEIIAMRAAGISTSAIYKPVFYFSFLVFLGNLYLMNVVLPRGNKSLQLLKAEIFTSSIEKEIKPRVFYDEYDNRVIYVNDVNTTDGSWKGIFISDTSEPNDQKVIIANHGRLSLVGPTRQVWLSLSGAENHQSSHSKPERYDLSRNSEQQILLLDRFSEISTKKQPRSYREYDLAELIVEEKRSRTGDPIDHQQILVELHKKFSIPFACLAFGIIGLPLGITNRRGGKSSGFSLSIGIILMYYIMLNNGEEFARSGRLNPALAMWAPNAILIVAGMYLIRRANSDRGTGGASALLDRLKSTLSRFGRKKKKSSEIGSVSADTPSLLSRLDIAFPNTLDRYILGQFVKVLALVILSTAVLFVVVDYSELAGEISEHRIPLSVVASYYRYYLLQVLNWILPLSVLFATILCFGILAKNNEVTAIKASGISLYRLTFPILGIALVFTMLSYFLLDFVLPFSNQRVVELKNRIKGKETRQTFSVQQNQWIFGKDNQYLFNFLSYDRKSRSLSDVHVFEFQPGTFRLTRRVWADEARFDGIGWVFMNGWIRSFGDDGGASFAPIQRPIRLHYRERPDYFEVEAKNPAQMSYAELRRYIQHLKASGYAAEELSVELHKKVSWPFISLVMALIALPFSFRLGKRGALYGVGIALLVAIAYWIVFGVFTKFGEVGNLPALLSAWSANILFSLAAIYLFLRVET